MQAKGLSKIRRFLALDPRMPVTFRQTASPLSIEQALLLAVSTLAHQATFGVGGHE